MRIYIVVIAVTFFFAGVAFATPLPYNEMADAKSDVEQALIAANQSNRLVLLIFGAHWCGDCRALDEALKNTKNAELISREFVIVKVDAGNFNHNLSVVEMYGNPIKSGIPAAVVLSPGNQFLYSTRMGELSNVRRMSETGVYDFFNNIASACKTKT